MINKLLIVSVAMTGNDVSPHFSLDQPTTCFARLFLDCFSLNTYVLLRRELFLIYFIDHSFSQRNHYRNRLYMH